MTKNLSNTLTRWHKIAERVKLAATELMQANLQSAGVGRGMDGDTFMVRKVALQASVEKAVAEKTVMYFLLQDALFAIRKALAHANTAEGVSDLLNEMEAARQKGTYYAALVDSATDCLSVSEFSALAAKKTGTSNSLYGVSVTFLSVEQLANLGELRDRARREVNGLADRLADANASKLSLALDEQVIAFLGL
jgi:hypothetical protein